MTLQCNVLAPLQSGLNKYFKPWIIGEDAWQELINCYSKRGTIRKRNGSDLLARVPAYAPGTFTLAGSTVTCSANHNMVSDQRIWIVQAGGEFGPYNITVTSPTTFVISGYPDNPTPVNGAISVYCAIQGLLGWETGKGNNQQVLLACTGKQICAFDPSSQTFTEVTYAGGTSAPNARNYELYQGVNFQGFTFITDFRDPIYKYDGTVYPGTAAYFQPTIAGSYTIQSCRAIATFYGRLVCFYTYENGVAYPNRARWSWAGDITDANAFRDDLLNGSGYDDADTGESFVGWCYYLNNLLAFFDRSIWNLKYTGDPTSPFAWERVNNQFGAGSTLGVWNFDDAALSISQYGIVSTNGNDVKRIDLPIIDAVQDIESSTEPGGDGRQANNFRRVVAQQDYFNQLVYWTAPGDQNTTSTALIKLVRNNEMLVWNYLENCWAQYETWYTTLYGFRTTTETTWAQLTEPWSTYTDPWSSYGLLDEKFLIVAGHDSGKVVRFTDSANQDIQSDASFAPYNFVMTSKFHNPYLQSGQRVRVPYIDLYLTPTAPTSPDSSFKRQATLTVYTDDDTQVPFATIPFMTEGEGKSVVRRVYTNAVGRNIAFQVSLDLSQITNPLSSESPFELQGMLIYSCPAGRFVL